MDRERPGPKKHSDATKRLACQYLVASMTPQWPTGNATLASQELAKRGIDVPAGTIDKWRENPKFRELFAQVKAEHYRALEAAVMEDSGLEPAEQMAKIKSIYLKRLLAEAYDIPVEKLPEAYEKVDRSLRLEQGKPTGDESELVALIRDMMSKPPEELRELNAMRQADIASAAQAVDNPHALEKKPN